MDRQKIIKTLNEALNKHIKIFSIKMVSRAFDCKMQARSRNYEYLAPFSLFMRNPTDSVETVKQNIKEICARYIGTNKYHNFSHKLKYDDANSTRNILAFDPEFIDIEGR